MKIGIADHISIFSFLFFWIRKREKETWLPYLYFPLWNRRMKNERTVYTTRGCFPFIMFSSCKEKTKMGTTDHISIFRFFVWWLQKRKRMLFYSLSIFYYEIEKTKNERTVYTRIGSALYTRCGPLSLWYITWINIIHDTNVFVPIPYMTATYHNIPHCLDGPVAQPICRPIWPTLVGVWSHRPKR